MEVCKMKKILKVVVAVMLVILTIKFITSSFFIWMVAGAAVPQLLKFVAKKGYLTEFRLRANAYRYTLIGVVTFTVIRLLMHRVWLSYLIASLIGVAISYIFFETAENR